MKEREKTSFQGNLPRLIPEDGFDVGSEDGDNLAVESGQCPVEVHSIFA